MNPEEKRELIEQYTFKCLQTLEDHGPKECLSQWEICEVFDHLKELGWVTEFPTESENTRCFAITVAGGKQLWTYNNQPQLLQA